MAVMEPDGKTGGGGVLVSNCLPMPQSVLRHQLQCVRFCIYSCYYNVSDTYLIDNWVNLSIVSESADIKYLDRYQGHKKI